jgi:hypothetical protein
MDHMFEQLNLSSRSKATKNSEENRAPIELLSQVRKLALFTLFTAI